MAKVKLTKTELKAQTDALKRFQRFLPMLQLKKQQLQSEIAGIVAKAEAVSARERAVRDGLNKWVGLFATDESSLEGLVKVKKINTGNIKVFVSAHSVANRFRLNVKIVFPHHMPSKQNTVFFTPFAYLF